MKQSATGPIPSHSTPLTQDDATRLAIDDTQTGLHKPPLPPDVSFTSSLPSASPSPSPSRNRARSHSPNVTRMTESSAEAAAAAMNAAGHGTKGCQSKSVDACELDCSSYIMDGRGSAEPDRTQPTQRLEAQLDRALMSTSASSSST